MKYKIITAALLVIVILSACAYYFVTKNEKEQYRPEVTVEECGGSYQKASETLMERYLSHYCSPFVGLSRLLTDYKLSEINAFEDTDASQSTGSQKNKYRFTVTYSVRMFTENDWVAGNGVTGNDNWVNDKVGFGYFHKENNTYILDGIGTGP